MDHFQMPRIDPEIMKISEEISERKKKDAKKQYLKDHFFQIYDTVVSTLALFVAIAALILSIINFNFSKGNPPPNPHADLEAAQTQTDAR